MSLSTHPFPRAQREGGRRGKRAGWLAGDGAWARRRSGGGGLSGGRRRPGSSFSQGPDSERAVCHASMCVIKYVMRLSTGQLGVSKPAGLLLLPLAAAQPVCRAPYPRLSVALAPSVRMEPRWQRPTPAEWPLLASQEGSGTCPCGTVALYGFGRFAVLACP